jgi:two-component system CheB/CheR fusion protein
MARDDLLRELRTGLHRAVKERTEIVREGVVVPGDGGRRSVRLCLRPFHGLKPGQQLILVSFEEMPMPAGEQKGAQPGVPVDPRVAELERQLASVKESLQSTVEEVETSNEELRSTNEELQSANEELQSTNEELETSKEELQSVNEELMTVNNELQKKLEELSQANNDLTNLLNSTEIGTIFLDNDLRIKRFTPAVTKLINLIPTDVGRPVADIVTQLADDGLAGHAREVLRTLSSEEAEVRTKDDRWFLRRILPYRTSDNVIDGAVVTFVNITEIREARRMVEAMLAFANSVLGAVRQPVVLLNKEGRVVQVNQAFYALFQARREDTLGARIFELDGARWAQGDLKARLDAVIAGGPPLQGYEMEMELPAVGKRRLRLNATRTAFGTKAVAGEDEVTVLSIEDGAGAKG